METALFSRSTLLILFNIQLDINTAINSKAEKTAMGILSIAGRAHVPVWLKISNTRICVVFAIHIKMQ